MTFSEFGHDHRITPNYHDPLEMVFVVEGRGEYTVDGNIYPVGPGDWILIGPREFHLLNAVGNEPLRIAVIYFSPELFHSPDESPLDCEWLRPFYYRGPSYSHLMPASRVAHFPIMDWLARIYSEMRSKEARYVLAVRTYMQNILLEAVRLLPDDCTVAKSDKHILDIKRMEAVFDFVDDHLAEDVTVEQACRMAHMSRAYFHRFFKKVTNMTLTEYVHRKRIDWARDLLLHTDLSVTQVALRVGFGSASYFDRVFSQRMGYTPSSCRRQSS